MSDDLKGSNSTLDHSLEVETHIKWVKTQIGKMKEVSIIQKFEE